MEIKAFQGWRHRASGGDVSTLICPPYDVLSQDDKDALLARDGRNIVAVEMPHWPPKDAAPDSAYRQAAETLSAWQSEGHLVRDEQPCLYAYQQRFTWAGREYVRRAILAAVRLEEFGSGVWPHEHTMPGPKADRLKLSQATGMQVSPLLGFHADEGDATGALFAAADREADASGTLNGVEEKLWAVGDAGVIEAVTRCLAGQDLFIADGHHRYTTALSYRESVGDVPHDHPANFVMFALAAEADSGLIVLPTHRVIAGLKGFDLAGFISAAGEAMDFEDAGASSEDAADAGGWLAGFGAHAMGFAAGDRTVVGRLTDPAAMERVAADETPAWRELDVAILHRLLLDDYLADCRTDETQIRYVADGAAALAAARSGAADLVVLLQGTPLSAVREIALAGEVMPPKSTYFHPKLATGMVLYPLT